ncbi:hypothetical protein A3Q36_05410 [Geobacillus stearothermophilus]|nr:hypothetical protein GLN3_12865 [Geobacillus lituanicus]KZM56743.1 hypothetical protein A3Q36_05410 [Geobacillus stearothermophilus]
MQAKNICPSRRPADLRFSSRFVSFSFQGTIFVFVALLKRLLHDSIFIIYCQHFFIPFAPHFFVAAAI